MTPQRSAADRIRPILQAMEESIKSARRNRVKAPAPSQALSHNSPMISQHFKPTPPANPSPVSLQPSQVITPDNPQRLKAKPKRVGSPFPSPFEQGIYRSQTG